MVRYAHWINCTLYDADVDLFIKISPNCWTGSVFVKSIGLLRDSNHYVIHSDSRQYGVSCQNISLKFVPEQLFKFNIKVVLCIECSEWSRAKLKRRPQPWKPSTTRIDRTEECQYF